MTTSLLNDFNSLHHLHFVSLYNDQTNEPYIIITNDLIYYVPVGIIFYIDKIPFIYFDELNGPHIFQDFGPTIYKHSLNWNQEYKREEEEAHRNLNILIIQQEDIKYADKDIKYADEPYLQLWSIDL